jgi:DNA-binding MarR family transcriptional regulator
MSSQVLRTQALSSQAIAAWVGFLRGHAVLVRTLNQQLVAEHGLTINDYEVLLRLSGASERRMKRVELARSLILTPSGITRLLDGLQAAGWVEKAFCASDARVTYAVLTDAGNEKLREAAESHLADIDRLFVGHFDEAELVTLAELLGRLDGGSHGDACAPA